jgi:hypothetical protein
MSVVKELIKNAEWKNKKWEDAWEDWELLSFVDMIIAKSNRALIQLEDFENRFDLPDMGEDFGDAVDSVMDLKMYAKRLKEVIRREVIYNE